jgi:hypothetical protein
MLIPRFLRRSQAPLKSLTRPHSLFCRSFASTSWRSRSALQADEDSLSKLPGLDASKLSITNTITPKKIVPPEELVFGRTFTGLFVGATSPLRMSLIQFPHRSHVVHRMDGHIWLAGATYHTLPESLARPCNMRLPLRFRMLRGYESLPMSERLFASPLPP